MAHYLPTIKHLNICVLGDVGIGKSSLIIQFVQSHFPEDHDPTLQDTYSRSITLDKATTTATVEHGPEQSAEDLQEQAGEELYLLDILDTVGIEDYSELRENQIQEADAIILCYDVTSKKTYDIVTVLHQQVLRCREEEEDLPPIVLCGTMSDAVERRQMSYQDGEILSEELGLNFYIETSAKLKVNVDELFSRTAEEIIKYRQKSKQAQVQANSAALIEQAPKSTPVSISSPKSTTNPKFTNPQKPLTTANVVNSKHTINPVGASAVDSPQNANSVRGIQSTPSKAADPITQSKNINTGTAPVGAPKKDNTCCVIM